MVVDGINCDPDDFVGDTECDRSSTAQLTPKRILAVGREQKHQRRGWKQDFRRRANGMQRASFQALHLGRLLHVREAGDRSGVLGGVPARARAALVHALRQAVEQENRGRMAMRGRCGETQTRLLALRKRGAKSLSHQSRSVVQVQEVPKDAQQDEPNKRLKTNKLAYKLHTNL